ncbi:MAG TPA: hypothetical protein VED16_00020 [Candidatus Acidoferrum sp.]|nr:hypothetical protein [Candidatus Acidoferrum sp.]
MSKISQAQKVIYTALEEVLALKENLSLRAAVKIYVGYTMGNELYG